MNLALRSLLATIPFLLLATPSPAQAPTTPDPLAQGFLNPPNSARPRVWWHWMNGNITEQGIDLDLDWMHRVGVGGFHTFDAALSTPTIVDHRLSYMTPEWKHAFNHALLKAEDLGLEVTIASSPGWSETGGPWVTPAQGMKKLVWSETLVHGEQPFHEKLTPPPSNSGSFQGLNNNPGPVFYKDVAVFAYPIPGPEPTSTISTSAGPLIPAAQDQLGNGLLAGTVVKLIATPDKDAWVQFSYNTPESIQSLAFAFADMPRNLSSAQPTKTQLTLERSDDGVNFTKAIDLPPATLVQRTVTFPAVTARYFRLRIHSPADNNPAFAKGFNLSSLQLFTQPRNPDFELKAGFLVAPSYYDLPPASGTAISSNSILDLTAKMSADGTLTWTPPPGDWHVLRLGYSLTGKTNHPAPPEATGLEVDQLNPKDVEAYLDHYLGTYESIVGKDQLGAKGIQFLLTDSTETGPQNWTNDMLADFKAARGYDARPWLPTLTGIVIDSPEATDRFLWDYRRTLAELLSASHYDTISRVLHAHGMGYYGESLEGGRPILGDDLEMRRATDIPMGAMWVMPDGGPDLKYTSDLLGAASVAHVYGRTFVGAESMTSRVNAWGFAPGNLKPAADMQMALGVNRFMIHEVTHQPVTDKLPGLSLGIYGQWFGRNETWAEQAKPWIDYLARCSFLLQQGRFYADLAYFYGEEPPLDMQFPSEHGLPENNGYDFVNSDMVLHELSVTPDGSLVTKGGATYRVLYLGGSSQHMTVPVLRRLLKLVQQGAVIAGSKPLDTPSLADDPAEFHRLTTELWGAGNSTAPRIVGKGHVLHAASATDALAALQVDPDWKYRDINDDLDAERAILNFVHRKLPGGGDLYFVVNRRAKLEYTWLSFAVTGKIPELWLPDTGERRPITFYIENNRTSIPLTIDPGGSVFIVFRSPTTATDADIPTPKETLLTTLTGPWTVAFEPNRGAPDTATFKTLTSWSDNPDLGIRYFSGHATYTKTITAPAAWFTSANKLWLDLGDVKDLAEITINGKPAGTTWKAPFHLDITGLLQPGENKLEVRVVNLWVNRIIGDLQPGTTIPYTFTSFHPYKADSPLLPSGLLGPVRILQQTAPQ